MEVFVSTMLYALGKRLGMTGALGEFRRQLAAPDRESLPVVRTIYRLQQMAEVQVYVDCGATVIGKARSRAMHAALESDTCAWVSIDDDIEATTETLRALLQVLNDHVVPRVVVVPHLLRGPEEKLSVRFPLVRREQMVAGVKLADLSSAGPAWSGFGMVGINRLALRCIESSPQTPGHFVDDDHVRKLAAFADTLADETWHGEDVAFFRRMPPSVEVSALLTGHCSHDGASLSLSEL